MKHSSTPCARINSYDMTESQAIRLASKGHAHAFGRLYRLHAQRVYRLCLRMVRDSKEAEDLTQETFLHLFYKLHSFRGQSRFSTWLHRVTVNVVLMRMRKKRYPEISLDATVEHNTTSRPVIELGRPDLRLSGMLDNINLNKAIDQLPEGYRSIFILHDIEGYEHREIANLLGCSIGNSKSQVFKARRRLRELLHDVVRSRDRERREVIRRSLWRSGVKRPESSRISLDKNCRNVGKCSTSHLSLVTEQSRPINLISSSGRDQKMYQMP